MLGRAHAVEAKTFQSSAFICRASHHSAWLSPRRPSERMPEPRLQLSCPPPQRLAEDTPNKRSEATAAPSTVVTAITDAGWVTLTKRTEASTSPSTVVPAKTLAGFAHADQAIRVQSSDLICRARQHSGWLNPRRPRDGGKSSALASRASHHSRWMSHLQPREQRPEQCSKTSCSPNWLVEFSPNVRIETRAAPSPVESAKTVAN